MRLIQKGLAKGNHVCERLVLGNDDNVALEYEDEQIRPLHGRLLSCGDFYFAGYQFTPPFVGIVFVKPENEIEHGLRSLEPLLDQNTVLVSHTPAFGALDEVSGGEHAGSPSLAALLDRNFVSVPSFDPEPPPASHGTAYTRRIGLTYRVPRVPFSSVHTGHLAPSARAIQAGTFLTIYKKLRPRSR
jgi:hypothetical protein